MVTLYEKDLKEIESLGWKWESLIFPTNLCDLAFVEEVNTTNVLSLITHGEVKVLDKEGSCIRLDEVRRLALEGKIYDEDNFEIIDNNWFSMDFGYKQDDNLFNYEDDYVFESEPKNRDELINILVTTFYYYFYLNK